MDFKNRKASVVVKPHKGYNPTIDYTERSRQWSYKIFSSEIDIPVDTLKRVCTKGKQTPLPLKVRTAIRKYLWPSTL